MAKIVYKLVFNRKNHLNVRGTALVQVEAYQKRRKKYFSTKVYLSPEQWDEKKQCVKRHPHADALNKILRDMLVALEKKELSLWQQGKNVTLEVLKEAWDNCVDENSFLDFFFGEVNDSPLRDSTKRNLLTTLLLLQQFKQYISFADLSFEFVTRFEHFLVQRGYHVNTIAKHLKQLKRMVNVAINKEYIEFQRYPFRKFRIKNVESRHTHLAPEELAQLEAVRLEGTRERLSSTLDAFLFCCYAGLRYSDFVNLTPANIVSIQGKIWLDYRSVKTNIEVRTPLYLLFGGKAVDILQKYEGRLEEFFHLRDNSNVNKELKTIASLAGLEKHISFHSARHTNATLLIYKGVNITTVQKLLGHKNVRTTQVYTNIMDMTIVHDLERSLK